MRRTQNSKRSFNRSQSKSFNKNRSRSNSLQNQPDSGSRGFGRRTKKSIYKWTEFDLIKTVEFSKKTQVHQKSIIDDYVPSFEFNDLNIDPRIKSNIAKKGYKTPTKVQDKAIPHILNQKDLIGIANTGTGKTAAFLIPLINKVVTEKFQKAFIVAPTRELAEQIYNEFLSLSFGLNIKGVLITGGSSERRQIFELKKNPSFIIGTPGRLKDLTNRKYINLSQFNNVVLDEADRMVDIGFIGEIKFFISMLPQNRQSLFFSATLAKKVQEIISAFVVDPILVDVKQADASLNVYQELVRVSKSEDKMETLFRLLAKDELNKVIIFGNSRVEVQKLSDTLITKGLSAEAIHGNIRQSKRRSILKRFMQDDIKILLATDVAARGLDIKGVSHVINYEMPLTFEDYIHRIGRTGRADKKGVALTFVQS